MKQTLTTSQAADILLADENANWSYKGARALVEYLEESEVDCDTEIEMDRVAIRCDFSEYESLEDWAKEYFGTVDHLEMCEAVGVDEDIAMSMDDVDDEIYSVIRDYITDRGQLIEFDGGIIVSSF